MADYRRSDYSEPNPICRRRPLTAITAVQALCNKIKLVRPMSQEPCLCLSRAGTPVCSVTILVSSSESLSAPSVDAPRWSEVTTKIARLAMRSSGICLRIRASCNFFSSRQSHKGFCSIKSDALRLRSGPAMETEEGQRKCLWSTPHHMSQGIGRRHGPFCNISHTGSATGQRR